MILGAGDGDIKAELGVWACWHVMDSEVGISAKGEIEGPAVGDARDNIGRFDAWG